MSTRREREKRNRTMNDDYFGYGYSDNRPMQKSFLGVAAVSLVVLGITTAYDKVKELITGKKSE